MAKSLLRQKLESTAPTGDLAWDRLSAAVELILVALAGVSGGSGLTDTQLRATAVPVSLPATARTPAVSLVTTNGTVASGKKIVDFIFSSDFTGTVLTVAFTGAADSVISFEAPPGDTLAAIAYTVTAGSIRIVTIT